MSARSRTGRAIAVYLASVLAAAGAHGAGSGYEWMADAIDGNAALVYGSPESGEDILFLLFCDNRNRRAELTLYQEIEGAESGRRLAIEMSAGEARISLDGSTATDEMNGFVYGKVEQLAVKPLIAVVESPGPLSVEMDKVIVKMPEAGRAEAITAFASACKLD